MSVIALLRTEFYMLMYAVAKEHRDLAKKATGKDRNLEIKGSMISILFSFTCLEAYINAIGKDRLESEWQKYEGNPIEAKWKGVSNWLATKKQGKPWSVFNDDKDPFESFLELKKIREDYLVHWKADFGSAVKTKYGNTAEAINTLNCEKAEWACNIVKEMVIKLNDNIDNPLPTTWLD
jgi:hypothetical protein